MKSPTKPCFLLLCLVAGIYVMRNSNVSFGNAVKYSFRVLQEYRPSEQLCTGVSIEDTFSQSEIDRAQGFKDSLQGMRNGNPLKDVLTSGSMDGFASDYAIPLIPFIAPWIVLFALSVFITIGLCCNWCCIYGCCKKAKCCKCCKAPKDATRKRIYIALSAFFLLGTFGTGIAGIVISSQVPKGMELTICSFIAMAEDLAYGVPAKQWIGATPAVASVGDLISNIDSAIAGLTPTPDSAVTDITTTYNAVKNQLDNVMKPNLDVAANKNVPRSDPSQAPNTYTSTYISQISTFVDAIDQECIAKKDAVSAAQPNIRDAIQQINSDSGNIKTQLINGQTSMNDISVSIQDFLKTLDDFGGTSKDIIKIIGTVLQAIFIVNLVLGVFGLASMVMVGILKIKFFNKFLHFNWCVLLLFTIFGWILSCIFYPLSIVMMESCDVLDSSLTSESTLNSVLGTLISGANEPDGIGDTMGYCLFSADGDLAVKLGIAAKLEDFLKIGDEFNTIPSDIPIADARPPCLTLNEQKTQAADWKIGKTADAPESAADLLALTKAVNKGFTPCTTLYDTWQLNSVNCNANSYKFVAADADNKKVGEPTCIGFDVWTTSPPGHTIANRYTTTQFPGCSTNAGLPAETYARNFVNTFITARAKVKTVFTNVETELGQVEIKYNDFGDKLQVVLRDFAATQTALNTIQASLTGATSGIATNLKCAFIGDSMRRISDSMCVGFISGVYQSSVVIIIASVFTMFGSIFVFCLAKRFILEGKDSKAKPI